MIKAVVMFFAPWIILGLFSCAHNQPSTSQSSDIAALEKKVAETNEKVDTLVQRMSVLQLMVDSQQRSLQDLKNESQRSASVSTGPVAVDNISEGALTAQAPSTTAAFEVSPPFKEPAPPVKTKQSPDADALYKEAYGLFQNRRFQPAMERFDTFAARYPSDNLADNALFWAGECRYALKDYTGAVRSFKAVLTIYPEGNKVPDSLLKLGYSYLALGDNQNGTDYLKKAIKNYPFSSAAVKAEQKLKLVTNR
ncbi:MAG: tol-pal system protein YbgF [Desulfobacterales bacterium]|jgi:tol-pal system protein YbgF|nr:tol-pal system protein YbgF [Desulfobacterales bacterium]